MWKRDKKALNTNLILLLLGRMVSDTGTSLQMVVIPRKTSDEYMSRVFSIVGIITKGGIPLGALMYGFILNSIEMHWTIFSVTLLMILVSVVFLISLTRTHDINT